MEPFGPVVKIVIIGDSNVGKTCIVLQYTQQSYSDSYVHTVGLDFKSRVISIDSKSYKVQLWDTAGQERYRSIRRGYYRGAKGIILVYDITNPESFANLKKWVLDITEAFSAWEKPPLIVLGNKADLEGSRKVSSFVGEAEAQAHGARFAEVSAKTGAGVDDAIYQFIGDIVMKTAGDSERSNEHPIVIEHANARETCDC